MAASMIKKILLILVCLFLCCSKEEPYSKRIEEAFFSDSPIEKLHDLRSEIYGREAKAIYSKYLNKIFRHFMGNIPLIDHRDTTFSEAEMKAIDDIQSCVCYLMNMNAQRWHSYDSVKTFYNKTNSGFDTTFVGFIDYTAMGKGRYVILLSPQKGKIFPYITS